MSRQAELFAPARALLYPAFETYRLRSLDPDTDVAAFSLPGEGATQSRVGYNNQQLGFKEVRARIAFDHLETCGSRGVYVDAEWNVVGFELDDELQPVFTILAALPAPINSAHAEYPRALCLSETVWAVSSGSGSVYILSVSLPGSGAFSGSVAARYDLSIDGGVVPFLLCAAHTEGAAARLLVSRAVVQNEAEGKYRARRAVFELLEVQVDITHANAEDSAPETLAPRWTLTGGDVPYFATWSEGGWIVLSEDAFKPASEQKAETDEERMTRERNEKVAKLGLGASLAEPQQEEKKEDEKEEEAMDVDEPKAYPFRWTQDTSSVTITVPLPAGITRSDLDVKISREALSINIRSDSLTPPLAAFAAKGTHAFWTDVVVDESTWTFDAAKAELEIEVQKAEEDSTRWPSVFVPGDDDDDEVDDVPETFAPSTLAAIRASFSHAVHTRDDTPDGSEPRGNPPTIPALAREDMDIDFDDDGDFDFGQRTDGAFADLSAGTVGRSALIGFVASDNGAASWSRQPASILSLPVTSAGPDTTSQSVIVKTAVDGLVFTPPSTGNPSRTPWTHIGTNPALAFVMSSKRDLRLVRHVAVGNIPAAKTGPELQSGIKPAGGSSSGADAGSTSTATTTSTRSTVLAFDSGSGTGNGNVYVYYAPEPGQTTTARQGVVSVSGGDRGALLGVGAVTATSSSKGQVVVALCEKHLVVLGGVL